MANEQFKSFATSTLNGSITNSQTTVTVNDASTFPTIGYFRILVDSEIMRVDSVSGNVFTVDRGVDGSSAASHTSGVNVTQILTAGALTQYAKDTYDHDAWANVTSFANGRLALSTDSAIAQADQGGSLVGIGDLKQVVPPNTGSMTWINQGTATIDNSKNYTLLWDNGPTVNVFRFLSVPIPGSRPYKYRVKWDAHMYGVNFSRLTLGFYDSISGRYDLIEQLHSTSHVFENNQWTSISSYNATRNRHYTNRNQDYFTSWVEILDDGTDIWFGIGVDEGFNFWYFSSASRTAWLTNGPDHVVIGFQQAQAPGGMSIYNWQQL